MARFGDDRPESVILDIRANESAGFIEAFLSPKEPPKAGSAAADRLAAGVKLIQLDTGSGLVRIFPKNTNEWSEKFLGPKYKKIVAFTLHLTPTDDYIGGQPVVLDEILESLPPGFIRGTAYGLGLLKGCNRLIDLIEEHTSCDEIEFVDGESAEVDGTIFRLGLGRFGAIWAELGRIDDRSNRAAGRVKDAFVHNDLAEALGLEPAEYSLGRHPVSRVIAKAANGIEELSDGERNSLVQAMASESAALASTAPEKFQQLRRDIELVSLESLIEAYSAALDAGKSEPYWQRFFNDNAFALQQVFGAPMVNVRSGATVGGRDISGSGDKIADYLFKNSLTNNIALVEIKKPATPLLTSSPYRDGVYGPSTEINGAITQVLDQAYQLTKNLPGLKDSSRQYDLESYAVSCFVVAGRTPTADEANRQKSFELFRSNSRSVTIVTYDEILERLKLLRDFLAPANETKLGAV